MYDTKHLAGSMRYLTYEVLSNYTCVIFPNTSSKSDVCDVL